tara:strand:- start:67 stop:915 length:849 start_codon:yes stop_codon:yes gene_type:complete
MRVSIIGYGFVGKAIANALKTDTKLQKIDPKLNTCNKNLKDFIPDIIFICVPTPMNSDGSQNIDILMDIIDDIKSYKLNSLVVIKSTVLPSCILKVKESLPKFVYNPEFLREKHANEDFINSNMIVFGGDIESSQELASFYDNYFECINNDYIFTDLVTASLVKYSINSFLATKVIFFNEISQLFKKSGAKGDWKDFLQILYKDKRIGKSHMEVPGHDGRYGFGGACLPKDSNALVSYAESMNSDLELVKTAIRINNKIRKSYNKNTIREDEQNILFEDLDQ